MKRIVGFIVLIGFVFVGCVVGPVTRYRVIQTPAGVTSDEILRMTKAGLSDAVIIEKINAAGVTAQPTAEQIESLKKQGVSEPVLAALASARVATPEERVVEYAYDYPSYSYYPYSYGYPYYPYGYYGWYGYPYSWSWHYGHYPYYGYYSYPRYGYSVHRYR